MRCGQCEYYDDSERWGSKGHCDYNGNYVYASDDADDCSHFKKAGSGGGCYMTTACCEFYGLPDDCRELTAMRKLRDEYIQYQEGGQDVISEYYATAPKVISNLMKQDDKVKWIEYIYLVVQKCTSFVEKKEFQSAMDVYVEMVNRLKNHFLL